MSRDSAQAEPIPYDESADDSNEADSAVGDTDSVASSSTSLTDSIMDYRRLHGRTFGNSKTTEYWGPNDDQQNDGLDITHHWLTMLQDDKLFTAPICDNPQNVLDIGTGTGIWAMDMADLYPSAQVIGTDISPIQPSWSPPNCKFYIEDCQLEWTFPENHFDFIYMRTLFGCVSDWPALYQQIFKATKPGGWHEANEFTNDAYSSIPAVNDDPDHVFHQWARLLNEAGDKMGKTFQTAVPGRIKRLLDEAGFVDVVEKRHKVPIGGWSSNPRLKKIGEFNLVFMVQSIEGFGLYLLTSILGWTYDEAQVLFAKIRAKLKDAKERPYYEMVTVYGRKPEGTAKGTNTGG